MTKTGPYEQAVERIRPERPAQPAPLTAAEVGRIIDLVVAYTRREPDATMIQVWAAQSLIGRWTCAEAERAIHLWGANRQPGDFLEPGDVTRTIRADRQDRALRAEQKRLESGPPANPAAADRIREIVADVAARKAPPAAGGAGSEQDPRGVGPVLSVACPHCHAGIGAHCTTGTPKHRKLSRSGCHPARAKALAEQLKRGA
jgi:hypothetical protein